MMNNPILIKLLPLKALVSTLVLSATMGTAMASDFTLNPMVGVAKNKAMGTNAALGLEAGYKDFILGYSYTGDSNKDSFSQHFDELKPTPFDNVFQQAKAHYNDDYKAHTVYAGYQFSLGSGYLALKAGAEFSNLKMNAGVAVYDVMPGGQTLVESGAISASSNTVVKPMVGVGYYMDNGLNFNLHYTIHNGNRDMKGSAKYQGDESAGKAKLNGQIPDKDFSTLMFTVGYRF